MIHDLDSQINRITESDNYMEQLQQVTGNIFAIDRDYLAAILKRVEILENMIVPCLKQYFPSGNEIIDKYSFVFNTYNPVRDTFFETEKKKKDKKKCVKFIKKVVNIDHNYIGKRMIESEWFKLIKEIEKKSNDLLESFDVSSFDKVMETYNNDKMLLTIKVFYGEPVNTPERLSALKNLNKITRDIIDIYTKPMYDVKKKIESNWGKIGNIFKDSLSNVDVRKMLEQFIICKYRCELTGNSKYYMRLFENIFSEEVDGSKFLRIVDSIDDSQLDKKSNVYVFSEAIKEAIHSLGNKEKSVDEVINHLQEMMDKHANKDKKDLEKEAEMKMMDDPLKDLV